MTQIHLAAEDTIDGSAELFVATGKGRQAAVLKYRRFAQLADALRHAVEIVGLTKYPGTVIECADVRLNSHEIADRYAFLPNGKSS